MTIMMPETTKSFGAMSLVVLTSKPADLEEVTLAAAAAGENISCHSIGDWWPTASTEKAARQRKMCQTKTSQALGTTTWDTPTLRYTYNPQTVGTPGSAGNEAYEVLPEGAVRYLLQRLGVTGDSAVETGDAYRLIAVELGPQVPGVSSEDAGGEFIITQEVALLEGYSGPIDGVIVAAA